MNDYWKEIETRLPESTAASGGAVNPPPLLPEPALPSWLKLALSSVAILLLVVTVIAHGLMPKPTGVPCVDGQHS